MAERDPSWSEGRRNYPAYEEDYGAWIAAPAELLEYGNLDDLDLKIPLDEVAGLAKSNLMTREHKL